jgi:hypothetical protein
LSESLASLSSLSLLESSSSFLSSYFFSFLSAFLPAFEDLSSFFDSLASASFFLESLSSADFYSVFSGDFGAVLPSEEGFLPLAAS